MNLEEALKEIERLKGENAKIIKEKKEIMELFDEKDKENMTENEKKIADILQKGEAARIALEKELAGEKKAREDEKKQREADEKSKLDTAFKERLDKVSKGDAEVRKQLEANVAALTGLPRGSEKEIDAIVNSAYNMLGNGTTNPLNAAAPASGNPDVGGDAKFGDTAQGKSVADKLGMTFQKPAEDPKK